MTLSDLLSAHAPVDLSALAMVFSDELAQRLEAVQDGEQQHVAKPRRLIDGRWMLCADLLTEVHGGGLYARGFSRMDPARFAEVSVITMEQAKALLPSDSDLLPHGGD